MACVVLVCTKVDLRDDEKTIEQLARIKQNPITREQGKKMAKHIGATAYVECSAMKRASVEEVIETAVRKTLNKRKYIKKLKKMRQIHHARRNSLFESFELHLPKLL